MERISRGFLATNNYTLPTHGLAVAGGRLWRYFGIEKHPPNSFYLQSCAAGADPLLTANWSATLSIGDGYTTIQDMVSVQDQLFAGMPTGLYVGDQSGTFFNVLDEASFQQHPDNCRDLAIYNGAVIAQHIAGVFAYQQSGFEARVKEIGPAQNSNRSPARGYVRALATFGGWLYGGLYTGSQSHLIAGRDTGDLNFQWHLLNRLPHVAKIHRIHFDGLTTTSGNAFKLPNRVWIATDTNIDAGGTAPLYWCPVPLNNGNPLASDIAWSANYIGSARIDLGAVDWGAPGTPKIFRSCEVWADSLLSGYRYGDIYYDVDQSGSFTLLGRAQTSPKTTLYFSSGEGSFITGQSIELSLRSFTASPADTPVYRALVLRGALQPRSVDMIQAVARIGDGLHDRHGAEMRTGATMLQELRDFASPDAQGLQAHQLVDLTGATQWVKVLGNIDEQEVWQQGEEYPEIAATVRMAVLSYS